MTRMQRFANFLKYFWKNSALLTGFSVVALAIPTLRMQWADYAIWFWLIVSINCLNLAITIFQYLRYIRFGR